jgi:hypothetical protein
MGELHADVYINVDDSSNDAKSISDGDATVS